MILRTFRVLYRFNILNPTCNIRFKHVQPCKFVVIQKSNVSSTTGLFHETKYEWQDPKSPEDIVRITFVKKDGTKAEVNGKIGDNLLYLAHRYGVEMEGACEASLACTTCHVYVEDKYLSTIPEATETEEDLLDMAPFLKPNSRLGCQIILTKDLDGAIFTLPKATRNFYVDGHTPTPH